MDKAMELLEQLAINLGVAAEYLWETLVRQQYVEGITDITISIILLIAFVMIAIVTPRFTKTINDKYKELAEDRKTNGTGFGGSYTVSSCEEDTYNALKNVAPFIVIIVEFFIFVSIIPLVTSGIQQLFNPDYFALKEILETISGTVH